MIAMTTSSVSSEAVRMAMVTTTPTTVGKVCPLSTPTMIPVEVNCVLLGAVIMLWLAVLPSGGVGGSGGVGSVVGGLEGVVGGWVSGAGGVV